MLRAFVGFNFKFIEVLLGEREKVIGRKEVYQSIKQNKFVN